MRQYKKPTGERIAAAFVDMIFLSIITTIFVALYYLFTLDFDNLLESFIASSAYGEEGYTNFITYSVLVELVLGTVYFVIIPWKWNGQTLAKKLLKIKAINEYGENPTLWQHFVRGIQNWTAYFGIFMIIGAFSSEEAFLVISMIIGFLIGGGYYIALLIAFIMILSKEDGRGLHDLLSGTRVVRIDEDLNKDFAMKTAQMADWAEVIDEDDEGFKPDEKEKEDDWNF